MIVVPMRSFGFAEQPEIICAGVEDGPRRRRNRLKVGRRNPGGQSDALDDLARFVAVQ
jgi:hypothetical protein